MWPPNLADVAWAARVLAEQASALGIPSPVDEVRLLDVRLTHPHRPESARCRVSATYAVEPRGFPPVLLYVKGFPDKDTAAAAWREDRSARPAGRSVHLAPYDVVVWPFPDDPRLPALSTLLDGREVSGILPGPVAELFRPGGELRATMVRYQPELSATIRIDSCGGQGPTAFAKHLGDGLVQVHAARHASLWSVSRHHDALRIAEPLGADVDRGVLWTRGVDAPPLAALSPDRLGGEAGPVGRILAALHAPLIDAAVVKADELVDEMRKKADKLAAAHPPVERELSGIVSAAQDRLDSSRERVCTLHGDFHLDQLMSAENGPVLLDLDSIILGTPEIDLAEFLVDLALRRLPEHVVSDVADRLLSSYRSASSSDIDTELLSICMDAEFLNRVYRNLRRRTPDWEDALTAELARRGDVQALLPP